MPVQPTSATEEPMTDTLSTKRALSGDTYVASTRSGRSSLPAKEHNVEAIEVSSPVHAPSQQQDENQDNGQMQLDLECGTSTQERQKLIGWRRTTVLLIVDAIALGAISMPFAFAALGMVCGTVLNIAFCLITIFTAKSVGQVVIKYPNIKSFPDLGRLLGGKTGYRVVSFMFVSTLTLLVGGHVLACAQTFNKLIDHPEACVIWWSSLAGILLFILALPKRFKDFTILGYIDFASILAAVGVIIVAAGVIGAKAPGGLEAVEWSWGPPAGVPLYKRVLATMTIIFAYSFIMVQPAMMQEMHTPQDYMKSISVLGIVMTIIYTAVGAISYALIGKDVESPMLLSSSPKVVRIACGLALPVILISGSINTIVVGKFIEETSTFSRLKILQPTSRWAKFAVWAGLMLTITITAWLVAEAIPFFNGLLGLIASLFISGFSFYIPAWLWFKTLKIGRWNQGWKNTLMSVANAIIVVLGLAVLGVGAYASLQEIITNYSLGTVRSPFTCSSAAFS